jgi:hypothetical protein
MHKLIEALGPYEMVSVGSPGAEHLVIVMQGVAAVPPRGRRHQVKPVQGSVTLVCYNRQHDRLRWALAEEDAERSRWLAFHTWSEGGSRWLHQILFRTLKQARRGHRVRCLHGRRMFSPHGFSSREWGFFDVARSDCWCSSEHLRELLKEILCEYSGIFF